MLSQAATTCVRILKLAYFFGVVPLFAPTFEKSRRITQVMRSKTLISGGFHSGQIRSHSHRATSIHRSEGIGAADTHHSRESPPLPP